MAKDSKHCSSFDALLYVCLSAVVRGHVGSFGFGVQKALSRYNELQRKVAVQP